MNLEMYSKHLKCSIKATYPTVVHFISYENVCTLFRTYSTISTGELVPLLVV